MPKAISPEDFLKKACEKGSINNKHIITSEEVKKKLKPCTLKTYRCIMAMWEQYIPIIWNWDFHNTESSYLIGCKANKKIPVKKNPYNAETLQDFAIHIAYDIEGVYGDPIAYMNTVVMYIKDVSRGLKDAGHLGLGSGWWMSYGSRFMMPDDWFFMSSSVAWSSGQHNVVYRRKGGKFSACTPVFGFLFYVRA